MRELQISILKDYFLNKIQKKIGGYMKTKLKTNILILTLLIAIFVLLSITACNDDAVEPAELPPINASVSLSDINPEVNGNTYSAAVDGNNIYIVGKYLTGNCYIACYWLYDGTTFTRKDLSTDCSTAIDIAIDNGIVYIVGSYNTGEKDVACYWKVDSGVVTKTDLYTTHDSKTSAIYVSDKVYVSGWFNIISENTTTPVPCCWFDDGGTINTVQLPTKTSTFGWTNDMIVYNNEIYIPGFYTPDNSNNYTACLWSGTGSVMSITQLSDVESGATSIDVNNGSIYITGIWYENGINKTGFWDYNDGNYIKVSVENEYQSYVSDIAFNGNDIYLSGFYSTTEYSNYPRNIACYWKYDGASTIRTMLYNQANSVGYSSMVFDGMLYIFGSHDTSSYGNSTASLWTDKL